MNSPKLATKCSHVDRPEKARGMCQSCYRAAKKADDVASGKIKLSEETGGEAKTGSPVEWDLNDDKVAAFEFKKIMWGWLMKAEEAQEPIVVVDAKGKARRDFKLEARMQEQSDQRAIKAAQILGRGLIVERTVTEQPTELPVEGMGEMMAGWMKVGKMKKEKLDA